MLKKLLSTRLFKRTKKLEKWFEILAWWELRRLPYNLIVGITGIITGLLMGIMAYIAEEKFHTEAVFPDPPLFVVFGVILYGIIANICYTSGWFSELIARRLWNEKANFYGEIIFTLGTLFSVVLTFSPVLIAVLIYVLKLFASLVIKY